MKHIIVDSSLHYKKWYITDTISIYQSEVSISNCNASNNICEDALDIICSNFTVDSLFIYNSFTDGFDADF